MGFNKRVVIFLLITVVCILNVRCYTIRVSCPHVTHTKPDETCVSWRRLQNEKPSSTFFVYVSIWTFLLNVALCLYLISPFISLAYVVSVD